MMNRRVLPLALGLTALTLGLTHCNSGSSRGNSANSSYQETKMTLEEQERQNPTRFLKTQGTYKKNLLGEWVLQGTITNSATIATFKDVVLEVSFYSKTKTLLGTERLAIYEYFPARQTKNFKIKTFGYQGTKTIGWNISSASASN